MLGIPIALEAFKASKEVLVRRPAPPGIRPFLENKRSMQGATSIINAILPITSAEPALSRIYADD
jgi:hypothetical protein